MAQLKLEAGLNVAYQIKWWPALKTYLPKPVDLTYLGEIILDMLA